MMTDQMPFSPKLACLPIALVAFSMAFGAPVRAQSDANAPTWREVAVDPIMNAVHTIEQRITSIEATVALFAGSFTTQQINTRELCVSDESGAQTCITKAQLDALLAKMAQSAAAEMPPVGQAAAAVIEVPAEITQAPAIVTEAYVSPITEPVNDNSDAKASAALDPDADQTAVATVPGIEGSGSKEEFSAEFQPTPSETSIASAPEPAANEGVNSDQEPATTGSVTSEPSHDALVSHPQVEISYPDAASNE